ncbi:MAG: hypothetical protein ACI4D4_02515 [Lachnospira sp.]
MNEFEMNESSDLLGGKALEGAGTLCFDCFADIAYEKPAEVIASWDGAVGIVDQAVEKGRITVLSDTNFYEDFKPDAEDSYRNWDTDETYTVEQVQAYGKAAADLFERFLINSKKNMDTVAEGGDPNENFGKVQYTITATAGANGSISPSGAVEVTEGESKIFTITPDDGYEIDTLKVDGTAIAASASYTFSNVTAAHTIDVTFKQKSSTSGDAGEDSTDTHEHKWSDWVTDGDRQKATCDCGGVKYRDIPAADDNGKFEKEAEVTETSPIKEATLDNNKSDFVSADSKIFSDEEKAAIANGTIEAKVWVSIDGKDEAAVSQEDKTKIEDAAKKAVGNDNLDITYFDATLFKKVGTQQTTVAEPGIDIKVTIKIPEKLINTDSTKNREYSIIRLHGEDGSVETLGGTFNSETGEFTFVTDKFSTYAIVYKDVAVTDVVDETPKTGEGTTTGDAAHTAVWFILIMLSGLGLVLPYSKRHKCAR